MIAHVSGDRQHVQVISIPRDLEIDAPTCKQWDATTGQLSDADYPVNPGDVWHINSAYSVGGPQCTVRAVQDLTGLQIDRVIGIDFAGFQRMVDALGGITMNICGPIVDAELQTVVAEGGVQIIGGEQALSLVRARKVHRRHASPTSRGSGGSRWCSSSILQQVTSAGTLLNPAKLDAFLQAFVQNTFTDNVTIDDLVTLAQSFGNLDPEPGHLLHAADGSRTATDLELDTAQASAVFAATWQRPAVARRPGRADHAAAVGADPVDSRRRHRAAGVTVEPGTVELEIVNGSGGRTAWPPTRWRQLNGIGFAVTEDQLRQQDATQAGRHRRVRPDQRRRRA